MRREVIWVITAVVFGIIGYTVGYGQAINLCVNVAIKATDITIDPQILKDIIIRYGRVI